MGNNDLKDMVLGAFGPGNPRGQRLLQYMREHYQRATFVPDNQYQTAYNLGQQDLVQLLVDIVDEDSSHG